MRLVRSVAGYFGWWSLLLLIVVLAGLGAWWCWDRGRQLPLPAQAQDVSSELLGSLARRTTFSVSSSVDVREFYRQVLPERGWSYCGTQATPGCSNLVDAATAAEDQVDIYRRAEDRDYSGSTIEVWSSEAAGGRATVAVFEANRAR